MNIEKIIEKRLDIDYTNIIFNLNSHSINFNKFLTDFIIELNIKYELGIELNIKYDLNIELSKLKPTLLDIIKTSRYVDYYPEKTYISDTYIYSLFNNTYILVIDTKSSDKINYDKKCDIQTISLFAKKTVKENDDMSSLIDDIITTIIQNKK